MITRPDEFYTRYEDIATELQYYKEHFIGARVYCNCDTYNSAFVKYFRSIGEGYGIRSLAYTSLYSPRLAIVSFDDEGLQLDHYWYPEGEGKSYDSKDSLQVLQSADIVCTNPPFSLFSAYINLLIDSGKKFLILGPMSAIAYKHIFPHFKSGKMWLGVKDRGGMVFDLPGDYPLEGGAKIDVHGKKSVSRAGVLWFTNLLPNKPKRALELTVTYTDERYPRYTNYPAINVDRVKDIPADYFGLMGVPTSFMMRHDASQYELIDMVRQPKILVNGVVINKYNRLIIQRCDTRAVLGREINKLKEKTFEMLQIMQDILKPLQEQI